MHLGIYQRSALIYTDPGGNFDAMSAFNAMGNQAWASTLARARARARFVVLALDQLAATQAIDERRARSPRL